MKQHNNPSSSKIPLFLLLILTILSSTFTLTISFLPPPSLHAINDKPSSSLFAQLATVPLSITRPPYIQFSSYNQPALLNELPSPHPIHPQTPEIIKRMRKTCNLARRTLDKTYSIMNDCYTTNVELTSSSLDDQLHSFITEECGAYPSPLGYMAFPKSVCISVNDVICHGIPSTSQVFNRGDLVNVDVTLYKDGVHGDCSETFVYGDNCETKKSDSNADLRGRGLVQGCYDAWLKGMLLCKPNVPFKSVGEAIDDHLETVNSKASSKDEDEEFIYSVKGFAGHGISEAFHTRPHILHYRNKGEADGGEDGKMGENMIFTIEPMICERIKTTRSSNSKPYKVTKRYGSSKEVIATKTLEDGWTCKTGDGGRSVQFEHTLLVTVQGVEALTRKGKDSPVFWWERDSEVEGLVEGFKGVEGGVFNV